MCLFSPSLEIWNIIKYFPADSEKKTNTEALKLSIKQMFSENNTVTEHDLWENNMGQTITAI